jgi:hypothetical protein
MIIWAIHAKSEVIIPIFWSFLNIVVKIHRIFRLFQNSILRNYRAHQLALPDKDDDADTLAYVRQSWEATV